MLAAMVAVSEYHYRLLLPHLVLVLILVRVPPVVHAVSYPRPVDPDVAAVYADHPPAQSY